MVFCRSSSLGDGFSKVMLDEEAPISVELQSKMSFSPFGPLPLCY